MKNLFLALIAIALVACSTTPEPKTVAQGTAYGAEFVVGDLMSLSEVIKSVEETGETNCTFEANIVETCAKAGCWMSIDNPGGEPIMVFMNDHSFFVPTEGMMGKESIIMGSAKRDTLSVEWLQHLAEDANRSQEEIDAITEPLPTISVNALGVVIKDV
ncbi:MAG: DUF4920 domain-containing protein [Flavobacteriales bacterium]